MFLMLAYMMEDHCCFDSGQGSFLTVPDQVVCKSAPGQASLSVQSSVPVLESVLSLA